MFETFILATVQSIAEFLPISSSGHLILVPAFLHWPNQGLVADIALHIGTLFSVLLYFRNDLLMMIHGLVDFKKKNYSSYRISMILKIVFATLPIVIVGAIAHSYISENFRSPKLIATTLIIGGILLYFADKIGKNEKSFKTMTYRDAFLIGCAQILAMIPGVSRSGITMTMARFLGLSRTESARFSMLMSIPTILMAGGLGFLICFTSEESFYPEKTLLFGLITAFIFGVIAIYFLMKWLKTSSFIIFTIYRLILGGIIFIVF